MLVTKWTKFKYSGVTKAVSSILILIGGTIFIWCFLWFMIYGDSTKKEVADSYEYSSEFMRRVHNVTELTTNLKSIENINDSSLDEDERHALYRRYNNANRNLNEAPNFIYIVRDAKTHQTIKTNTKLTVTDILEQKNHVLFSDDQVILHYGSLDSVYEMSNYLGYVNSFDSTYMGDEILEYLAEANYEVYGAIRNNLQAGDIFYDLSVRNDGAVVLVSWWQRLLVISSVIFAMGLILIAFQCGRSVKTDAVITNGFDRIFTEVQIMAFAGIALLVFFAVDRIRYNSDLANMVSDASIQLAAASFLATMIGLVFYCSLIRQIKGRLLFKTSILGMCCRGIKRIFWRLEGIKLLKPSWVFFFFVYGLASLFSGIVISSIGIPVFIMVQMIFGAIFLKQLAALKKIMETTQKVSKGELDVVLDTARFPKVMVDFYDNIYHVQSDMRQAIQNAVKGERMKAELITNVSHDLKTPLTSIVSYIELLSKEPLETEASKEYVDILIKKSDMLKRLIDDLIDASKVSTGNVQIECTEIELNELIRQSIGEFEEKFASKALDVRVQEIETLTIRADGKSMWRVVENLFDNITKYALPESRVYIQLIKGKDKGIIVAKNISENALEISPEELMQRFVRGSESRTSEGSGLGLSIAEGLVKAQNGNFEIHIDGDLFKVTIEMPLN